MKSESGDALQNKEAVDGGEEITKTQRMSLYLFLLLAIPSAFFGLLVYDGLDVKTLRPFRSEDIIFDTLSAKSGKYPKNSRIIVAQLNHDSQPGDFQLLVMQRNFAGFWMKFDDFVIESNNAAFRGLVLREVDKNVAGCPPEIEFEFYFSFENNEYRESRKGIELLRLFDCAVRVDSNDPSFSTLTFITNTTRELSPELLSLGIQPVKKLQKTK